MTRQRHDWVDVARAIAVSLVVLDHAINWLVDAGIASEWWYAPKDFFTSMRMPLLFLVSGMFAGKWMHRSWKELATSKLFFLVWIYLVWTLVGALSIPLGAQIQGRDDTIVSILFGIVTAPVRPRGELWFIWALALFFILIRVTRSIDYRLMLIAAVALSLLGWLFPLPNVGWSGLLKYLVFFLAGVYLRDQVVWFQKLRAPLLKTALVVVWAACAALVAWSGSALGLFLLSPVGVLVGIVLASVCQRARFAQLLGRNTLQVYVAHTPIIILIVWVLWRYAPDIPEPIADVLPLALACVALLASLGLELAVRSTPLRYLFEPPKIWERAAKK